MHALCTASHSQTSSPSGLCTANLMSPDPRVALANWCRTLLFSDLWPFRGLKVLFLSKLKNCILSEGPTSRWPNEANAKCL